MQITVEQLAELAKEFEATNSDIDWENLSINRDQAYLLMSANVIELISNQAKENLEYVLSSSLVALLVENFVLNLRLGNTQVH